MDRTGEKGIFIIGATNYPDMIDPAMLRSGPVSYTHLRAHETVLDLVCRLLLEKKKQNPDDSDHLEAKTLARELLAHHGTARETV